MQSDQGAENTVDIESPSRDYASCCVAETAGHYEHELASRLDAYRGPEWLEADCSKDPRPILIEGIVWVVVALIGWLAALLFIV